MSPLSLRSPMKLRRCGGEAAAETSLASQRSSISHTFPALLRGFGCNEPQNLGPCLLWILELSPLGFL
ncbi:hypothetical protein COCNU_06G010350 [Cocos nucifera]|uniref:Uncharacterized protein n=1 Tax=Cocos nucifera TaxID=13894 RepID=A0A8K0ICX2_COCNU|nr:hypothetical protein COCNU_06G010350 [Cocos nucifera]